MSRNWNGADSANFIDIGSPAAVQITGQVITVSAWVNPATSHDGVAVGKAASPNNYQYILGVTSTGRVWSRVGDGSTSSYVESQTGRITAGQWNHIASRKTGNGNFVHHVWPNGVQDGNWHANHDLSNSGDLRIGRYGNFTTSPFNGLIAEVAIWNVALTDQELEDLAAGANPLTIQPDNLRGYWPLLGTTSPEPDETANGNDGTINGTLNQGASHPDVDPPNTAPTVDAGSDQEITLPATATLNGTVTDDGLPGAYTVAWSKVSGPGTVTFDDDTAEDTTATFSEAGTYVLRLTADDGSLTDSDDITITVAAAVSNVVATRRRWAAAQAMRRRRSR